MDIQQIYNVIYLIRGQRIMLDEDLAKLYGVETKVLNQAVRRNTDRFPSEFMFKLSMKEFTVLKSQIVTSSWGGRRKLPMVFTEHGAVMLANVLRSKLAVKMSIEVVKAFIQFRQIITSQQDILNQISEIRSYILKQSNKTDKEFKKVWKTIEELINSTEKDSGKNIGFKVD